MSASSHCWHCNRGLVNVFGHHKHPFTFTLVKDQLGNEVRVHKKCVEQAEASVRSVTAAPREGLAT